MVMVMASTMTRLSFRSSQPSIFLNFVQRFVSSSKTSLTNATTQATSSSTEQRRRLDVALVGAPNAGKSQLLNCLTKSSIAAVSRKRHTTRSDILGARTVGNTQIVFKDTPGFMRLENAKEERLDRDLIVTAASELQTVDFSLLVVDAARTLNDNYRHALVQLMIGAINSKGRIEETFLEEDEKETEETLNNGIDQQARFAIVLNKVDLVQPKSKLLDLAMDIGSMADMCLEDQLKQCNIKFDFETMLKLSPIVFYVSALKEDGTADILDHLLTLATPCNTWAVPADKSTNLTRLEQVQEIIREKIYRTCHKEVPHSVQQVNRMFRKVSRGIVIHQDLVVYTKSHQRLVLGSGGRTLQRIEESARKHLQQAFGCDVALQLHVKLSKSKQRRGGEDEYRTDEEMNSEGKSGPMQCRGWNKGWMTMEGMSNHEVILNV